MTARAGLLLALAGALAACDLAALDDALDEFRVILSIDAQATVVGGLVVDARTGDLVEAPVVLTYAPSVPGAVVDGFGDPIDGETVEGGAFNFAIADALGPPSGREVEVVVRAEAEGYAPLDRVVVLADTGAYDLTLDLERAGSGGGGSGAGDPAVATATVRADGAAGLEAAVALSAVPRGGRRATVSLARGAVLSDADGQPLDGPTTVTLTAYDPLGAALPTAAPRIAASVWLAGVRVEASTAGAAAVTGPARVLLALPPAAVDPLTGAPLEAGLDVEARAYDPAAAAWVPAGTATVEAAGAGLALRGDLARLGLFTVFLRTGVPTQTVGVRVERNGSAGPVRVDVLGAGYQVARTIPDGGASTGLEVPVHAARSRLRARHGGRVYEPADGATCLDCVVALYPPSRPVTVLLRPACPSPGQRVYVDNLPTFTLSARERGTSEWRSVGGVDRVDRRADGSLEAVVIEAEGLVVGPTYDVLARYLSETHRTTFVVPPSLVIDEAFDAPASLCQ